LNTSNVIEWRILNPKGFVRNHFAEREADAWRLGAATIAGKMPALRLPVELKPGTKIRGCFTAFGVMCS
jgi:hypothetical protein